MKRILAYVLLIQIVVVSVDFIMGARAQFFNAYALWQETFVRIGFNLNRQLPFVFLQDDGNENAFIIAWLFFGSASLLLSYLINTVLESGKFSLSCRT